jgi:S1-C subfamily serine protease
MSVLLPRIQKVVRALPLGSVALLVLSLLLSACGTGLGTGAAATPVGETTASPVREAPSAVPTAEPDLAVTSAQDARRAVVQIEAQGTFERPEGTAQNAVGTGSGFLIDESGLAVTNNHVVTGAALIKVYFDGENEARNARLLGASECSDLAVIQIEGEEYPYIEWFDGDIGVGLDVFAAGFPLGEPEYTLTRGIISKERADGRTNWSAVETVLEHDAAIRPGSSGGPLLTEDGQAVGINYRGRETEGAGVQYYAIARDEARDIIGQLERGRNITWIGINGAAFSFEGDQGNTVSGIWVYSVETGSPARNAGIREGDILMELEGLQLATDGTMTDYCDILRARDVESDTIRLKILRLSTNQILEGELNGKELEPVGGSGSGTNTSAGEADASGASGEADASGDTSGADAGAPAPEAGSTDSTAAQASLINTYAMQGAELEAARNDYDQRLGQYPQILNETFDSATTKRQWREFYEDDSRRIRLINRYYELLIKPQNTIVPDHWDQQALGQDYLVQLDVAVSTPDSYSGILFDYQDGENYSLFAIGSNDSWLTITYQAGEVLDERSGTFSSTAIIGGGNTNQVRVFRTPEVVQFWVNHTLVGEVPPGPLSGGNVGLVGVSGDQVPATVIMDNLYIWTR